MSGKRGNSEGSIYRRSDGRWCGAVSIPGRRRRVYYGATRLEVARKLTAALKARDRGTLLAADRQTVADFLEGWLRDSVRPAVRPSTYDGYEQLVRMHINPVLGRVALQKLTAQQVQAFINDRLQAGLSPATVLYARAVLRRALGQALKWGLVERNVATLVDPPKRSRAEIRPFDPDEARRFLDAVRGDRLEALFSVALALGLRQGEALGLRWEDVDLTAGTLAVRHALQRVDGRLTLLEPKTARSRRTLHMPRIVVDGLRQHRARQLEDQLLAGPRWIESGFVFTSALGTPLDGGNVTHRLGKILARSGLRHQRFHDLRHACASLLLAQGVSPRVVMETLGHSQISLTMDTYSHVIPALQKEAADKMDALLGAPRS